MPVTLDRSDAQCVIRLHGEVNIALAPELKGLLLQALASGLNLRVDLTSATDLDIALFQLLWAAERDAAASGKAFQYEGQFPEKITAAVNQTDFERTPLDN